jgi:pimeloyl-ACP methyl ester carboxylesterase
MLCPELPSVGADPPRSLHDDARHVRAELELLIEHGEKIIVVMHSYGGMVGTQAAARLGLAERARKGQQGGVIRLFYACSFMLPAGFDLDGSLGGLPPWIKERVNLPSEAAEAAADELVDRMIVVVMLRIQRSDSTTICHLKIRSTGPRS